MRSDEHYIFRNIHVILQLTEDTQPIYTDNYLGYGIQYLIEQAEKLESMMHQDNALVKFGVDMFNIIEDIKHVERIGHFHIIDKNVTGPSMIPTIGRDPARDIEHRWIRIREDLKYLSENIYEDLKLERII